MYLGKLNKYGIFKLLYFIIHLSQYSECRNSIIENQSLNLTDTALTKISNLSDPAHFTKTLDKILIPRVPGTIGHTNVRDFIIKSMEDLDWQVDRDAFTDSTPNGVKIRFENIIATQNPSAERFLIMACHYDSKYFKEFEFLGATDSAVPCAMLINLANVMNGYLKLQNKQSNGNDIGLMYVFFDGEEAFVEWSPTDSIYGARHLAAKWESEGFLQKIDTLMLLDLLGGPDPKFYSMFKETENAYSKLISIEEKLSYYGVLENYAASGVISSSQNNYFQQKSVAMYIEDDHIPFIRRKVPTLHLITVPFPEVWHKEEDNRSYIDFKTVENLNKIFRIFVAEYLNIQINE